MMRPLTGVAMARKSRYQPEYPERVASNPRFTIRRVLLAHPSGFEPLTYGFGVSNTLLVESSKPSRNVGSVRVGTRGRVQPDRSPIEMTSFFGGPKSRST